MNVSAPVELTFDPDPRHPAFNESAARVSLLAIRIASVVLFVAMLIYHFRTMRMFRWELSVTGGLLVTFCMVSFGLALCAGVARCGGVVLQIYLCVLGFMMFVINSMYLAVRWHSAGEMTHVLAELLVSMGVPLSRTMKIKVGLSVLAAVLLLIDVILVLVLNPWTKPSSKKLSLW